MTKSTDKLHYERNYSQRTGSVAKIAGGLGLVHPKPKIISDKMPNLLPSARSFANTLLYAGGFVERNGFNCVEGFWKRLQATLFYKG